MFEDIKNGRAYLGDCLEVMKDIPCESVDMILTDLPYGTTSCKWDSIIPFEPLWKQYERIIKTKGAIVLSSTQPFTSKLISSNMELFKYCWAWDKCNVGGFVNAKLKPLKIYEDICVFSKGKTNNCNDNNMIYYPQGLLKCKKITSSSTDKSSTGYYRENAEPKYLQEWTNYPTQLLKFPLDSDRIHPTQIPVALFEYLIKTYTLENEIVLDSTAGSFTTTIAAENTNRRWICIEKDEEYYKLGTERVKSHTQNLNPEGFAEFFN